MVSLRPLTQGTPASAPRPRGRSTLDPLSALRTMEGIRFAGEKMRRLLASCVVLALALCPGGVSAAEEQPEEAMTLAVMALHGSSSSRPGDGRNTPPAADFP